MPARTVTSAVWEANFFPVLTSDTCTRYWPACGYTWWAVKRRSILVSGFQGSQSDCWLLLSPSPHSHSIPGQ